MFGVDECKVNFLMGAYAIDRMCSCFGSGKICQNGAFCVSFCLVEEDSGPTSIYYSYSPLSTLGSLNTKFSFRGIVFKLMYAYSFKIIAILFYCWTPPLYTVHIHLLISNTIGSIQLYSHYCAKQIANICDRLGPSHVAN